MTTPRLVIGTRLHFQSGTSDAPEQGESISFVTRHPLYMPEQEMTKSTTIYWNTLSPENRGRWTPIKGLEGIAEELTLSIDPISGEYTRLTRFLPGADTTPFGGKSHPYPEEVFIVSGRLYDQAFGLWLEAGHYASRPPGELHGPVRTDVGCVVLEVSFPNRVAGGNGA